LLVARDHHHRDVVVVQWSCCQDVPLFGTEGNAVSRPLRDVANAWELWPFILIGAGIGLFVMLVIVVVTR